MWVWFSVWMNGGALVLAWPVAPARTSGMPFAFSFASEGEPLAADQDDCRAPQACSEYLKSLVKNPKSGVDLAWRSRQTSTPT